MMLNRDVGTNATPGREGCNKLHVTRLCDGDEVVQNAIGDILVKNPLVAKSLEVELQALEFHAYLVWRIDQRNRAEIGLPGLGADGRKFWTDGLD